MAHSWLNLFSKTICRGSQIRRRRVRELLVLPRRLGVEPLEKRLLLTVTSSFNSGSGLLTIASDAADPIAIEISGGLVQINNAAPSTGPLSVAAVTNLSISSGPGGGIIDLSQIISGALPNLQSGQIQGSGVATLIAPLNQANNWSITGVNQGTLNSFTFQGVQNLTGGNQSDAFQYTVASALLTGTLNEPAGGNLAFAGSAITLAGTVTTHGGNISINDASVINSGGSVTLQGNIYTQGGNLTVFGDTITLNDQAGPVTVSTRDLASVPGNPATDSSVGNSGNIAFTGINITLGTNTASPGFNVQTTNLYCQVDTGSQFTAGNVNLTASQIAGAGSGNGFNFPVLPQA